MEIMEIAGTMEFVGTMVIAVIMVLFSFPRRRGKSNFHNSNFHKQTLIIL